MVSSLKYGALKQLKADLQNDGYTAEVMWFDINREHISKLGRRNSRMSEVEVRHLGDVYDAISCARNQNPRKVVLLTHFGSVFRHAWENDDLRLLRLLSDVTYPGHATQAQQIIEHDYLSSGGYKTKLDCLVGGRMWKQRLCYLTHTPNARQAFMQAYHSDAVEDCWHIFYHRLISLPSFGSADVKDLLERGIRDQKETAILELIRKMRCFFHLMEGYFSLTSAERTFFDALRRNDLQTIQSILSQVQWIKQSFYDELKEAAEVLRHNTILEQLVMFTKVKPDDECNILQSSFDDARAARRIARQLGWSVLT